MPESLRIYLDQMFQLDVAETLRGEGYDVMRASEFGQARADDQEILQKAIEENRILITLDEHFKKSSCHTLTETLQMGSYSVIVKWICQIEEFS